MTSEMTNAYVAKNIGVDDSVNWGDDFESLFRVNYPRLVRSMTLISANPEAAADAVSEAFIRAHLRWRTVSEYDDPVSWVRRVAINLVRDDHRRRLRKRDLIARLGAQRQLDVEGPETRSDEVTRLLAKLPRQQRSAMALHYIEGLSIHETAEVLRLSEGAVKFHLSTGREKLRRLVGQKHGTGRP